MNVFELLGWMVVIAVLAGAGFTILCILIQAIDSAMPLKKEKEIPAEFWGRPLPRKKK